MALKRARGATLIELVIYFGLSALALGLIVSIFKVAQRTQQQTYSQYLVGGKLSSTIRLLRRELQATALASISVYPDDTGTGQPGLSCVSAYSEEGEFVVSGYGVPDWQKYVYYSLGNNGSLSRWKGSLPEGQVLPVPSVTLPSELGSDGSSIMPGLLPPNQDVGDFHSASPFGGFEVSFLRLENGRYTTTQVNPANSTDYENHTRLVQVTLRTYEERSQPDFSEITFRVCPRY